MSEVSLKCRLGSDTRLVRVSSGDSWEKVRNAIANKFDVSANLYQMKWQEKDESITIVDDDDWKNLSKSHNLELTLQSKSSKGKIPEPPKESLTVTEIKFSDLTVGKRLGEGNFGSVFAGQWRFTDVAIKKMNPMTIKEEEQFKEEAELIRKIPPHPNIVQFFGVSTNKDCIYLVMEKLNSSLDTILMDRSIELSTSTKLKLIKMICAGLEHLHDSNLVHRDLAARNCLVNVIGPDNYALKITDFGLSRFDGDHRDELEMIPCRWTAIEAIMKGTFSKASDIWSLGVVMWEVLARCTTPYPYLKDNNSVIQFIDAGNRLDAPEDCPEDVYMAMCYCWNEKPDQRPTARQMCDAVGKASNALDGHSLSPKSSLSKFSPNNSSNSLIPTITTSGPTVSQDVEGLYTATEDHTNLEQKPRALSNEKIPQQKQEVKPFMTTTGSSLSTSNSSFSSGLGSLATTSSSLNTTGDAKAQAKQIVDDPKKARYFLDFLDGDSSNKELRFYFDVQLFRRIRKNRPEEALKLGTQIAQQYLEKDGKKYLEFPAEIAKPMNAQLQAAKEKGEITPDIFDAAQSHVMTQMEAYHFPRFLKSVVYLTMYNQLTSHSGNFELPQTLWDRFIEAANGGAEQGWEFVQDGKGVLVHRKTFDKTQYCLRGVGVVPLSLDEMKNICWSLKIRTLYESQFDQGQLIEKLDDKSDVVLLRFKKLAGFSLFVTAHEFVIVRTQKMGADGSWLYMSQSVVHQNCPENPKKYTRSEIDVSGWILKPHGPNTVLVTYVNQVSMKNIPKWAESYIMKKRPLVVKEINKFVEQEQKAAKKEGRKTVWNDPNYL